MLRRTAYEDILAWKNSKNRKALLVTGARQIGKTFLVREFAKNNYDNFVEINFALNPRAKEIFDRELSSEELILRLSLFVESGSIDNDTLIFFDEIQEAPNVLTSIKGLIERGDFDFIMSGSLLGVELRNIRSNPVGYVQTLKMYPLTFTEFCDAVIGKSARKIHDDLLTCFRRETEIDDVVHERILDLFRKYIVVGGMPDAVNEFLQTKDINSVRAAQDSIKDWYRNDISKYCEGADALKAKEAFDVIPAELNNQNKRFVLKTLNENARFRGYEDAFLWLCNANVALPAYNVSEPTSPLLVSKDRNLFKLFYSDTGLLSSAYSRNVALDILDAKSDVNKGALYESVVAQELVAHGFNLYYFNSKKLGELDFVIEDRDGNIFPIEVKSGKSYKRHNALNNVLSIPNYSISEAYVFSNSNIKREGKILYLPIYMISLLNNNLN